MSSTTSCCVIACSCFISFYRVVNRVSPFMPSALCAITYMLWTHGISHVWHPSNVNLRSFIHPHSFHADLIRNATAIIWNELPAANRPAEESLDDLCRTICNRPRILLGFIGL
ncbi:hypothetical protein BDR04DRAFT_682076 [Suillus decipiens]|nr:hypothetical protein BDR04DRAFT_682076 [Suillus decipiens]